MAVVFAVFAVSNIAYFGAGILGFFPTRMAGR